MFPHGDPNLRTLWSDLDSSFDDGASADTFFSGKEKRV
jgi:hypothetical protein